MPNITAKRLEELESKERAHDDYLEATREVKSSLAGLGRRNRSEVSDAYLSGYRAAIEDWARSIVKAAGRRIQPT